MIDIRLRSTRPQDESLIYSSWIQSHRECNILKLSTNRVRPDGRPVSDEYLTGCALWNTERYYRHQRQLIDSILPKSNVTVACNPEDEDQIYGYAVWRPIHTSLNVISYLYVKHTFRKAGIARRLFESIGEVAVCTHGGVSVRKLIARANLIYDPTFDLKDMEITLV